jgi:hypothetical protein
MSRRRKHPAPTPLVASCPNSQQGAEIMPDSTSSRTCDQNTLRNDPASRTELRGQGHRPITKVPDPSAVLKSPQDVCRASESLAGICSVLVPCQADYSGGMNPNQYAHQQSRFFDLNNANRLNMCRCLLRVDQASSLEPENSKPIDR